MQQPAAIILAEVFLLLLVDTVEGSTVEVRGRLVDVDVSAIGPEDAGNKKESEGDKLDPVTEGNLRVNGQDGERG